MNTAPLDVHTEARPDLVSLTHVIYGLHALSAVIGITTGATVVGSFVFGLPSIVAVILNYVKRSEVRGTFLDSHFSWQIRTFWFAAGLSVAAWLVSIPLMVVLVGFLTLWAAIAAIGIWIIYRVVRGWLALREGRPMPLPV